MLASLLLSKLCLAPDALAGDLSTQLPDIGKVGAAVLSPREEQQLGKEFMRSVQQGLKLVNDPPSVAYLQGLADRLVGAIPENTVPLTVFLVDDPAINAFAGPGGYIGIHTGLILNARSEAELVSVLAHEIAHVTQRHLVRAFEANRRMNLPTMGAIIAAIILGANNPQVGQAMLASSVANNAQQQLTFSRSNEQEADNLGLELMVKAGYDPRAMVAFFEKLQNNQRLMESVAPEFMRTHPLTLGRIADARNRAAQYPPGRQNDNTSFELLQARMQVMNEQSHSTTTPSALTTTTWSAEARDYLRALEAARKEDYPTARKILNTLIRTSPHRVLYPFSAAQVELADNQPQEAKRLLQQSLRVFPGNLALTEQLAETLLRLNQAEATQELLKTTLRKYPEHYRLYPLYAKAANALGKKAEAYRALAEWQSSQGNFYQAVDYLQQALDTPGLEPYDRLSLQARQEMLKKEILAHEQAIAEQSSEQYKHNVFLTYSP